MDIPKLKENVTAEKAAAALTAAVAEARNVPSMTSRGSGAELVFQYLKWTEDTETRLGNVFDAESVESLVFSEHYWQLRQSADERTPRLIQQVNRELQRREQELTAWAETFQSEAARWREWSATLLVPDTNVFLYSYSLFEQVRWPDAVGTPGDVRVVVPLLVVYELDRLKRRQERMKARRALKWLRINMPEDLHGWTRLGEDDQSRLTTLEMHLLRDMPSRTDDPDESIIKFAVELERMSGRRTLLATGDLSMQQRARALGATPLNVDDDEQP